MTQPAYHFEEQKEPEVWSLPDETAVDLDGSMLVAKYFQGQDVPLDELILTEITDLEELRQAVTSKKIGGRARELGQREIEHAVNYVNPEKYVFLRELIQNAFNITRAETVDNREVKIDTFYEDGHLGVEVEDAVGMDLNRIVSALLIPTRSVWEGKVWGFFGQGFFTTFKEADRVRLISGDGTGKVNYIDIVPVRKGIKVVDLKIKVRQVEGEYKGTKVHWLKKTEYADIERQRVKNELINLVGLVREDDLRIVLDGEVANVKLDLFTEEATDKGLLSILGPVDQSVFTHNGIQVRKISNDDWEGVPKYLKSVLVNYGVVLAMPEGLEVIENRNRFKDDEQVIEANKPLIRKLALTSVIRLFVEEKVKLEGLPYDFFALSEQYEEFIDEQVIEDGQKIARGERVDLERYLEDEDRATLLLLSMPTFQLGDNNYSLFEVVKEVDNPELAEHIPGYIRERVTKEKKVYIPLAFNELEDLTEKPNERDLRVAAKESFEEKGFTKVEVNAPGFILSLIGEGTEAYELFIKWTSQLFGLGDEVLNTIYSNDFQDLAHYKPVAEKVGILGWNLFTNEKLFNLFIRVSKGHRVDKNELLEMMRQLIDLGTHEMRHHEEGSEESWGLPHTKQFFRGQLDILDRLALRMLDDDALQSLPRLPFMQRDIDQLTPAKLSAEMKAQEKLSEILMRDWIVGQVKELGDKGLAERLNEEIPGGDCMAFNIDWIDKAYAGAGQVTGPCKWYKGIIVKPVAWVEDGVEVVREEAGKVGGWLKDRFWGRLRVNRSWQDCIQIKEDHPEQQKDYLECLESQSESNPYRYQVVPVVYKDGVFDYAATWRQIADDPVELVARAILADKGTAILDPSRRDDVVGVAWVLKNRYEQWYGSNSDIHSSIDGQEAWFKAVTSGVFGMITHYTANAAADPASYYGYFDHSRDQAVLAYFLAREIAIKVLEEDPVSDPTNGADHYADAWIDESGNQQSWTRTHFWRQNDDEGNRLSHDVNDGYCFMDVSVEDCFEGYPFIPTEEEYARSYSENQLMFMDDINQGIEFAISQSTQGYEP